MILENDNFLEVEMFTWNFNELFSSKLFRT